VQLVFLFITAAVVGAGVILGINLARKFL